MDGYEDIGTSSRVEYTPNPHQIATHSTRPRPIPDPTDTDTIPPPSLACWLAGWLAGWLASRTGSTCEPYGWGRVGSRVFDISTKIGFFLFPFGKGKPPGTYISLAVSRDDFGIPFCGSARDSRYRTHRSGSTNRGSHVYHSPSQGALYLPPLPCSTVY